MKSVFCLALMFLPLAAPALNGDRCEVEAVEMAELLDEVTQDSYEGESSAPFVRLTRTNTNFSDFAQYDWEVVYRHESHEGEVWYNNYGLTFNELSNGDCQLVTYKFYFDIDEGFLVEE